MVARDYLDGALLYDRYIAELSNDAIGLWMFASVFQLRSLFPQLIDNIASCKAIVLTESLIYEIYLTHHIFIKGDWSVFKYVENQSLAIMIIIVVSIISSVILHRASKLCRSLIMRNNHRM